MKGNCFFINRVYTTHQFALDTCEIVFEDGYSKGRLYEPKDHGTAQEVFLKAFEILEFADKAKKFWIGVHDITDKGYCGDSMEGSY